MRKTQVIDRPEHTTVAASVWQVILFSCDCHSFDETIRGLMRCGMTEQMAEWSAMEAHMVGRTIAYEGEKLKAEQCASILKTIGLEVELVIR